MTGNVSTELIFFDPGTQTQFWYRMTEYMYVHGHTHVLETGNPYQTL